MKRLWKDPLFRSVCGWLCLLVAHAALMRAMAQGDAVSRILSPGPHLPLATLALAGVFVLVRVMTVFCLPGLILMRLGDTLLGRRARKSRDEPLHPEVERVVPTRSGGQRGVR